MIFSYHLLLLCAKQTFKQLLGILGSWFLVLNTIWQANRAYFYSRLPAGHNKSAGLLAHITCEVGIHFIPNLASVIFTVRNNMPFEDPKNWIYYNLKNLFPLLIQFPTDQRDTWFKFPVRSLSFLWVIPADLQTRRMVTPVE